MAMRAPAGPSSGNELDPRKAALALPELGPKLARYRLLSRLESGGNGALFVAHRKGADEICVIKQIHEHLANDPVVAQRFLREAQLAALLEHRNIARILDADFA